MKRFALLLPLLLLAGAAPRAEFRLQDLLPADTVFFAEIPSAAAFREAVRKTSLYRLFQEEEVRLFANDMIGQGLREFDKFKENFEKEMGIPLDKAWEVPSGQVAFAMPSLRKPDEPDLVLSVDCAGKRETLLRWVAAANRGSERRTGWKVQTWKIGDDEVMTLASKDRSFHAAVPGDVLLVATRRDTLETVVTALRGGRTAPLADSANFRKAREKSGARDLFFYFDLNGVLKEVRDHAGEKETQAIRALGLEGLPFVAGGLSIGDAGVTERLFLAATGERKGLARLLSLKGAAPGLENAPQGALGYSSISIDLAELYDTLLDTAGNIDTYEAQRLKDQIEEAERILGFSIRNDLLASLGPRVWSASLFPPEGLLPEGITAFEIRNAALFDKCLKAALKNIPAELGELDFQGKKINYLKFDPRTPKEVRMILSTIYFLREGDKLYVSSLLFGSAGGGPNTLKRFLLRRAAPPPSLSASPAVQGWLGGKTNDASFVMYLDLERLFNCVYNSAAPVVMAFKDVIRREMKDTDLKIDLMKLPLGETIGKHLSKVICLARVEPDGLVVETFSAGGTWVPAACASAAVGPLAAPALQKMKAARESTRCLSNLRMISFSMELQKEEKGRLPEATGKDFLEQLHPAGPDYRGPADDPNRMADRDVLICDEPGRHPDGIIHALRKDGTVDTLRKDDPDYARALETTTK